MIYFLFQSLLYTGLLIFTSKRVAKAGAHFQTAWNLALIIMIAGFLGARAFHVFFEELDYYKKDWLAVFRFWEGGFVFFGGFFGALASSAIYLSLRKEKFLPWADFYAPIVSIGYAFGRLGCLLTGCCYGSYCDAPWAIGDRHPTQIYAFVAEILVFLILMSKEKQDPPVGTLTSIWLVGHAMGRLFMESYRGDFRGPSVGPFSISSVISILILVMGVLLMLSIQRPKKSL